MLLLIPHSSILSNIYVVPLYTHVVVDSNYASRRSRTRDTVKLTVCVCVCLCLCLCVCSSCNCSTVAMQRKLTASIGF